MRVRIVTALLFLIVAVHVTAQERRETIFIDAQRTLRVVGTAAAETIVVEVVERAITVDYRAGETHKTATFALDAFDRLDISAGAGADFVNIIDAAEALDASKKALKLDGGDGDNVVVITHRPFPQDAAARLRALADISTQLEQLARRASDATTTALVNDTMKYVERVRTGVIDAAQALAGDADKQLRVPANELLEKTAPRVTEQTNAIFKRLAELTAQQEKLAADAAKTLDPTNGVFPADDVSEPPRGVEPAGKEPSAEEKVPAETVARAEQLAKAAEAASADARAQLEASGAEIERAALAIEERTAAISNRADKLSDTADRLAADGEKELTASSDRVLAVVGELRVLTARIDDATQPLREELGRSISMMPAAAADALPATRQAGTSLCSTAIVATNFYTGGNGPDIFFAPAMSTSSWSINGGNGFNVLGGGGVADDIRGGANSDIIFGRGGNDQIHGGAGNDLLVGEWISESSTVTGDDCIWGEAGVDILIGDNIIGSSGGTPGGADFLYGGNDTDLAFGDDFTDFVSTTLPGGFDTIEGNDGIDILIGCGGDDIIDGNDDIDFIAGNGGNDIIHGQGGRFFMIFGTNIEIGNLELGNRGNDTMYGGDGVDLMLGNDDLDTMYGGAQLDVMFGGRGRDVMRGEAGGVIITLTSGIQIRLGNLMFGNDDIDTMWGGGDLDAMFGQNDDDVMHGYDGNPQLLGIESDFMSGGAGDDFMEGDDEMTLNSNDVMLGGTGDDTMHGGAQLDFMFGQRGEDVMTGDNNSLGDAGSFDLMFGGPDKDTIDGGNGFDVIFGEGDNDTIKGDAENPGEVSPDLIFGGSGNDDINGGLSLDVILGFDGDDHILGDSNFLFEQLSIDFIFGERGADYADGGNATDLIFGQQGCDHLLGDNGTFPRISLDAIFGGPDDDVIEGGVSIDLAWGNGDNDTILGGDGADFLWGNEGCDTISGGHGPDFIWGNAGVDQLNGEWGVDFVFGNDNGDTISGGPDPDFLWGNDGNDLIHGDSGLDFIWGNDGDDCLYGDDGVDFIWGNNGNDCLHGGNGPDLLWGGDGDDRIFGDNGSDIGFGGDGDDKLDGGSGADILIGGSGTDEAWGGPGWDLLIAETRSQKGNSGLDCECKTETCTGTLCVRKFNDLNGNGAQNTGEAGLPNWTFQVTCGCTSLSLTTGANGAACATLFGGNCTVVETTQSGWTPTTATTQTVNVSSGQTANATFGNRKTSGEVCIRKFNDLNGNGVQNSGEGPLAGFVFQVTGGGTSMTVTTNSNGGACFVLPFGTYTVTELPQSGWTATTPATQVIAVNSAAVTNVTFGNRKVQVAGGEICVHKFHDLNRNGVVDIGEPSLGGWTFLINGGSGGTLTTLPAGRICQGFPVGTYTVTEVVQSGWIPTTPVTQTVTAVSGPATTVHFGNAK